jgi:hypothetical protein
MANKERGPLPALMRGAVVGIAALTLAACDGVFFIVSPGGGVVAVNATIVAFVGVGCAQGRFDPSFDVRIDAASTVDLTSVTLQMDDGTSAGGPVIPISTPALESEFGSVRIAQGATRSFGFRPDFACGPLPPQSVSAHIEYVDLMGRRQTVTARGPRLGAL